MDRSADVKVHQHSPVVYLIKINELMPRAWAMSELSLLWKVQRIRHASNPTSATGLLVAPGRDRNEAVGDMASSRPFYFIFARAMAANENLRARRAI